MQIILGSLTKVIDHSRRGVQTLTHGRVDGFFGSILLITAALLFSVNSLVIKMTVSVLTPWQIGFARFVFGLLFIVFAAKVWHRNIWGQHKLFLTIRGFASTIAYVLLIISIQLIPISQATVLFFLFPLFAALHGLWLNHDPVPFVDWIFIFTGLSGAILILWPGSLPTKLQWGHMIALIAATVAGFSVATVRKLRASNHPFTLYFYFCLVGAPVCLAPILGYNQLYHPGIVPLAALLFTAFLGLVGQLMLNEGFKDVPAHTGGMLLSSQVIFSAVLGLLFLKEDITWRLFLGSALILGSGGLLSFSTKKHRTKPGFEAGPNPGL